MGLIYISILLIAIAFLVVTIYMCFVLKRMTNTMKSLGKNLKFAEKQVEEMKPQLTTTFRESGLLIDDVTEKMQATDEMFDSVQLLGESIQSANTVLQDNIGNLTDREMDELVKPYIEGMKWSEVGIKLFTHWKNEQPEGKNEVMIRNQNELMKVTGKEG